ncbi:hypothetical protein E3N88_30058 [Mikania micrantha]|uniref:Uncharacterized protein n=1 Tax=Mikania micrantha TaxID=192012 RepID=A0A5N6MKI4_9ASTR|nr:hypothetical protein E3N88_30058 [Mikania micrantha]
MIKQRRNTSSVLRKGAWAAEEDMLLKKCIEKFGEGKWHLVPLRAGRTANDVKNYWNTHVRSRPKQQKEPLKDGEPSQYTMVTIIKPQPRTVSKSLSLYPYFTTIHDDTRNLITLSKDSVDYTSNKSPLLPSQTLSSDKINECLDELFDDREKEIEEEVGWSIGGLLEGEGLDVVEQEDDQNCLFDFSIDDVLMWDILDSNE